MSRERAVIRLIKHCLTLLVLALAVLLVPCPAWADVGPIWTAQGADIAPGQEPTRVQMVAEEVVLSIEALAPPIGQEWVRMNHVVVAHAEALFVMRNHDTEPESLHVWFPLTTGAEYGPGVPIPGQAEGFRAWVDGEEVSIAEAPGRDLLGFRDDVPWATWSATFPPGQDVELGVAYDTHPVEWGGWAVSYYVLETGGGWHGPIGEGRVTFRLPYEVTEMNVQLAAIRDAYTGPDPPFELTVGRTDVVWGFADLEPRPSEELRGLTPSRETDNLILSMMEPSAWFEIEDALAEVEETPRSLDAQLRLAQALEAGTQRIKSFLNTTSNALLIETTDETYRRALELAPEDVDVVAAYLEWLAIPRHYEERGLSLGANYEAVLARALELAPEDSRTLRTQREVADWRRDVVSGSGGSTPLPRLPVTGGPCLGSLAFLALLLTLWMFRG